MRWLVPRRRCSIWPQLSHLIIHTCSSVDKILCSQSSKVLSYHLPSPLPPLTLTTLPRRGKKWGWSANLDNKQSEATEHICRDIFHPCLRSSLLASAHMLALSSKLKYFPYNMKWPFIAAVGSSLVFLSWTVWFHSQLIRFLFVCWHQPWSIIITNIDRQAGRRMSVGRFWLMSQ